MELRALAHMILCGAGTLSEKLTAAPQLTDDAPGEPETVRAPARDAELAWSDARTDVPQGDLADPQRRAALLHAFANHELLAIELFAQMLLRIPDAPQGFRRGLATTLQDEQRHLRLYVERLQALGVTFGSLPLNRYLWDAMAELPDPLQFVTVMALTFEQANLDHMQSTAAALRGVGDAESAAILEQIGREEIQHVALGLRWFERWRADSGDRPTEDTWEAYARLLPSPLTPRRARGDTVWEEGRLQAGLSPEFVRELKVFSSSRGRPADVLWFNPDCELRWSGATPPQVVETLTRDLAAVVTVCARADDVVLAPRPGLPWLEAMQAAGFPLPEFADDAPERLRGAARPWGWTPEAAARARGWALRDAPPRVAEWGPLFAKTWFARLLPELEETAALNVLPADLPRAVDAWDHLAAELAAIPGRAVVKDPYGTSGRGQLRTDGPPWESGFAGWAEGVLERHGSTVVQPWFEALADLSCLLAVGDGGARVLGCTRFRTDRRGQYLGHDVGPLDDGLSAELRRALHGEPQALLRGLEALARAAGARLAAAGYRGPAGIDAVLTRLPQGLALVPLELNPRRTFGHLALALSPRVVPGRGGAFALLPRERALALLETPARCVRRGGSARLEAGPLALSDPQRAQRTVAVLVAAASPQAAWATVRRA